MNSDLIKFYTIDVDSIVRNFLKKLSFYLSILQRKFFYVVD